MGLGVCHSNTFGWNFADVTLADDETNSILLMMPIYSNPCQCVTDTIYASGTSWWPKQNSRNFTTTANNILEVKWNANLFTKNMGIRKQEIPLPEFCKIGRPCQQCRLNMVLLLGWFELWTQYPGSVVPLAMFEISLIRAASRPSSVQLHPVIVVYYLKGIQSGNG